MIEIKNLKKTFPNETAISYGDFRFETGRSYVLLGASGCGKSTLLNLIAGILTPTEGEILIDGERVSDLPRKQKDAIRMQRIGYIFQDFKLIPEMTVRDNIDLLRIEKTDTSDADALLSRLGIADKKNARVKNLSGGEKQRVAIVRAIVKHPEIVLADEPTGNLNYAVGETVVKELLAETKGKTLIAVTHDERLAAFFDERVDMNALTGGGTYDV